MGRYVRQPLEVEAFRWTGGEDQEEDPEWACDALCKGELVFDNFCISEVCLVVAKTGQKIHQGWWVLRGIDGRIWGCEPDVFGKLYMEVSK